jgi:cystathionine beta-lyase
MWVNYPGLQAFPGHDIARRQMSGFGAMLSFDIDPEKIDPARFVRKLGLIKPAVSLGGVETTITSPVVTSHSTMTTEERMRIGITETLFRLSVGIEHSDDIIADLKAALEPDSE